MTTRTTKRKHPSTQGWLSLSAHIRIIICASVGAACAVATGLFVSWIYAPLVFWNVTALILLVSLWISLRKLDADQTAELATKEDPGRGIADIVLLGASLVSLGAVGVLLFQASNSDGIEQKLQIALGLGSVIISWAVIHSLYTLRYAHLYFKEKGGIDFNDKSDPTFVDFAYLAFTIGMTYQVSDTTLTSPLFRKMALRHALLSYIFGTAIIASVINFVAGLGK